MKSILVAILMTSLNSFANTYFCQTLVNSEDPKQTGVAIVDDTRGLLRVATSDGQDNEIVSIDIVTPYGWRWLQWDRNLECKSTTQPVSNVIQTSFYNTTASQNSALSDGKSFTFWQP